MTGLRRGIVKMKLKDYILCAIFAAFIAVLAQVQIPLPFTPIPISLAVLAVLVTGGLLGVKRSLISIVVYILLGIIGIPVFAGFQGGPNVLVGPTGGYIIGYIPLIIIVAAFTSYATNKAKERGWPAYKKVILLVAGAVVGILFLYALGTTWFMISTGRTLVEALAMCVVPFIPGEIIKIVAFTLIMAALKKHIDRLFAS